MVESEPLAFVDRNGPRRAQWKLLERPLYLLPDLTARLIQGLLEILPDDLFQPDVCATVVRDGDEGRG